MMILSLLGPVDSYAKTNEDSTTKANDYILATDTDSDQSVSRTLDEKTMVKAEDGQGNPDDPTEPQIYYTAEIKLDADGNEKTQVDYVDPAAEYTKENERVAEGTKDTTSDRIHYLNLDDGESNYTSDAIIIESNGHYGLIDASNLNGDTAQIPNTAVGSSASGKLVLDYLEALGVEHLDFVIGTHSHSDHMGGIPDIVKEMENVYGTKTTTPTSTVDQNNNTLHYYTDGKEGDVVTNEDELAAIDKIDKQEPTTGDPVTDTENPVKLTLVDENTTYIYKSYTVNTEEDSKGWKNSDYFKAAEKAMEGTNKLLVDKKDKTAMDKIGASFSDGGTAADTTDDYISFKFGDFNISLYNLISRSSTDENANSIVTYVEKSGTKTVLLADLDVYNSLEQSISKAIVADHGTPQVVKLGHHGFTASTSKELIDTFNAKYAIVQTENKDLSSYSPFYNYMKKKGTVIYRTLDQTGSQSIVQDMTGALAFKNGSISELDEGVEEYQFANEYKVCKRYNKVYTITKTTITPMPPQEGEETTYVTDTVQYDILRDYYENEVDDELVSVSRYTAIEYGATPTVWTWGAKEGRWYKWWKNWNNYDWVFVNEDGTNAVGWTKINGKLYLFDKDGLMQHGFQKYEGSTVYLLPKDNGDQPEGSPAIGWTLIDDKWYYFDADGKGRNGWCSSGGNWYYIEDGLMVTGIKEIKGVAYNFGSDGKLQTGFVKHGGDTFYITGSGQYATGWFEVGSTWYCADDEGKLKKSQWVGGYWLDGNGVWSYEGVGAWKCNSKGWWYQDSKGWYPSNCWQMIDGKWYFFNASGYMACNEWRGGCWLNGDGSWTYPHLGSWNSNGSGWWFSDESGWYAHSSWQKINGTWYYFKADGYMATNTTIDGYYVDASGACK